MRTSKRIGIAAAVALVAMTLTINDTALAACNATVNGRPMSAETCALSAKIYGQVLPGDYLMDGEGNWVNANNPLHRGNIYSDARSGNLYSRYGSGQINHDGSWSHYNDLTGNGGVGGWSEGGKDCYYAYGWSNC